MQQMLKQLFRSGGIAVLATMLLTAPAPAFTITIGDPTTGQNVDIDIPDDPGQAFTALSKDVARLLEQSGAAVDDLVASVSGCITEESGKPLIGIPVFLLQDDIGAPAYGITAGETGIGLFSSPVVPHTPVPKPGLEPGCYWIPLPPAIASALSSVLTPSSEKQTNTGAKGFRIMPMAPGYGFTPAAMKVQIYPNGHFQTTPVTNTFDLLSPQRTTVSQSQ